MNEDPQDNEGSITSEHSKRQDLQSRADEFEELWYPDEYYRYENELCIVNGPAKAGSVESAPPSERLERPEFLEKEPKQLRKVEE